MKKVLSVLFFMLISVILLGCNVEESGKSTGDNNQDTSNSKVIKLKLNSAYPKAISENEPKDIAVEKFSKLVEERTDGKVEIDIFYSNQLVPQDQALDAIKSGSIDIQYSASYWGDQIPILNVQWLPFAFYSSEHLHHLMRNSPVGELYESELAKNNVKPLFYSLGGISGIVSRDPITSIEDMKGKTIRIGSGLWTSWYDKMGTAPANIAGAEQYEALQRGTVDGSVYSIYTLDTENLHEVVKNVTIPGVLNPILVSSYINLEKWNSIPEDLRTIIEDTAKELELEAIAGMKKIELNSAKAKELGVEVHYLTEENYEDFYNSSQIVWEEFASINETNKKMIELIKVENEKYLEANPDAKDWKKQFE